MSATVYVVLILFGAFMIVYIVGSFLLGSLGKKEKVHRSAIAATSQDTGQVYIPMTQNDLPSDDWAYNSNTGQWTQNGVIWQNHPSGQLSQSRQDEIWGAKIREDGKRGREEAWKKTQADAENGVKSEIWMSKINFLSSLPDDNPED